MKTLVFSFSILMTLTTFAEPAIKANFIVHSTVSYNKIQHFRNSMDCNWEKKGDQYSDLGDQEYTNQIVETPVNSEGLTSLKLNATNFREFQISDLTLLGTETKTHDQQIFKIHLNNKLQMSLGWSVGPNCSWGDYSAIVNKFKLQGDITVSYTVPSNQWLTIVSTKNTTGLLSANAAQIIGGISSSLTSDLDGNQYIWTKPGTTLQIKFSIPEYNGTSADLGNAEITFQHPPAKFKENEDPNLKELGSYEISQIVRYLIIEINKLDELIQDKKLQSAKNIFNILNYLLVNKDKLHKYVWILPSSQIFSLSDAIFQKVAKNEFQEIPEALHIKTLASLVAFEITLAYLEQVKPYCEKAIRTLPFSNKPEEMTGIALSQIYLDRVWYRLTHFDYQSMGALLTALAKYEDQHLTYAQVMNNKDEVSKLQKADDLLAASIDMTASPLYLAIKDLTKLKEGMGTIGAAPEVETRIMTKAEALAGLETQFFEDFMNHLELYLSTNNKQVSVSSLRQKFEKLIEQKDNFIMDLKNGIRFYSGTEGEKTGFYAQLTSQMTQQIEVLRKPISVVFFNSLRDEYFKSSGTEMKIKSFEDCMFGK